ncbi:MAG: hypothetical protein U5L11_05135 [Arhodomonas sp.]|nr:hypothetical protein [Arhodomonas sp.]
MNRPAATSTPGGHIEAGASAIIVNASGCGAQVKDYAHLLADDGAYRARAERVAALAVDPVEFLGRWRPICAPPRMPHGESPSRAPAPCSMPRAWAAGWRRCSAALASSSRQMADPQICCGSAGTYCRPPAADGEGAPRAEARQSQCRVPGAHCHRQHRLPDPSRRGQRDPRAPLAGACYSRRSSGSRGVSDPWRTSNCRSSSSPEP